MKRIIQCKAYVVAILAITLLVFSCKEKDDYDYSKIDPGTTAISGSASVMGDGVTVYDYVALPRGGSVWDWELVDGPATITVDSKNKFLLHVVVDEISTNQPIVIAATETTLGGITGEPDTIIINATPYVMNISGPETIVGSGATVYPYTINSRPGSTFTWSLLEGDATTTVSTNTKVFNVKPPQRSDNDTLRISVLEVPVAGLTARKDTISVVVTPFCDFDINAFVGTFDCDEAGYEVYTVHFTLDPEVENRIHNDNFWDYPGPDQTLYYDLSGDYGQTVTVPEQPFVYGDGSAGSVSGSGTYNTCDQTMIVDYIVVYGGDEYETHHEFIVAP